MTCSDAERLPPAAAPHASPVTAILSCKPHRNRNATTTQPQRNYNATAPWPQLSVTKTKKKLIFTETPGNRKLLSLTYSRQHVNTDVTELSVRV